MILKASLKVILQALKQKKKDVPEEVERWLGEDKIILYYNIKNVASTCWAINVLIHQSNSSAATASRINYYINPANVDLKMIFVPWYYLSVYFISFKD